LIAKDLQEWRESPVRELHESILLPVEVKSGAAGKLNLLNLPYYHASRIYKYVSLSSHKES